MAVENYGFSVPLEPARKWQKLGIVQMVQLAVERERRFVGVLCKGRREAVERPGGLFSHTDNVYAEFFPALAGGNKRYVIPGVCERDALFMEYPRIVAAVYAGKMTDSFHFLSMPYTASGSSKISFVRDAPMARNFRMPRTVYSTPLHTASGSGTRT